MLNYKAAEAFLKDENSEVRKAGIRILADLSITDAEILLVRASEDPDPSVWDMAREVLAYRQPWLVLKPFMARSVPKNVLDSSWGKAWGALRTGIALWVKNRTNGLDVDIIRRWISLPGAVPDVVEELIAAGNKSLAEQLGSESDLLGEFNRDENQLLFAPTYGCNLNCRYCYAKGWSSWIPGEICDDDLETLFSWAESQNVDVFILSGGEPTVYSKFVKFLTLARHKGIRVYLTTNALYSDKVAEFIKPGYIEKLITHYDQDLAQNRELHERFEKNLKAAKSNGLDLLFRYTLTDDSDSKEWNHILDIVSRFEVHTLHYACAFKNFLNNNDAFSYQVDKSDSHVGEKLSQFAACCASRGIKLHLCKPVPLCAFSDATLRKLLKDSVLRSACGAYLRNFSQNITVNPDLSTFPCNAIGSQGPKITTFKNFDAAGNHYSKMLKQLLFHPYAEKCKECLFFFRGYCQGSCLAEKYLMIDGSRGKDVF